MKKPFITLLIIVSILSQRTLVLAKTTSTYRSLTGNWGLAAVRHYSGESLFIRVPSTTSLLAQSSQQILNTKNNENAKKAVESIAKVVSGLKDVGKEAASQFAGLAKNLGNIAKLGAAFGFLGLAFTIIGFFLPAEQDKFADLTRDIGNMEARLTNLINTKFDQLELTNLKQTLVDANDQIQAASDCLTRMAAARSAGQTAGYNFHLNSFKLQMANNRGTDSFNKILSAFKPSVFRAGGGLPIPSVVSAKTQGDSASVLSFVQSLSTLLTKASSNQLSYIALTDPDSMAPAGQLYSDSMQVVSDYVAGLQGVIRADVRKYLASSDTYLDLLKTTNCRGQADCCNQIQNILANKYQGQLYITTAFIENVPGKNYAFKRQSSNFYFVDRPWDYIGVFWAPQTVECSIGSVYSYDWTSITDQAWSRNPYFEPALATTDQGLLAYWDSYANWGTNHWVLSNYPNQYNIGYGKTGRFAYWGVRLYGNCTY